LLETGGKAVVASGDGLGLIAEDKTR
jgi:hypothetical protein